MSMLFTRKQIGLVDPKPTIETRSEAILTGITGHWTGVGGTLFHPDPLQRLRGIQAYHMSNLGYADIAYHGAFDGDGNLYACRENRYVGAHAASPGNLANRTTLGIVFLEDERGFTKQAAQAWLACQALYQAAYKRKPEWYAHRYWGRTGDPAKPTACPGDSFAAFIAWCGGHA